MHIHTVHHLSLEWRRKKYISSNQSFNELKGAFICTDLLSLVGFKSFSLKIHSQAFSQRASLTQILKFVHDALKKALRIHVTERLLSEAQHGNNKTFFFEGFLGTDDYSESGAEIVSTNAAIIILQVSFESRNQWAMIDLHTGNVILEDQHDNIFIVYCCWHPGNIGDCAIVGQSAVYWQRLL